MQSNLEIYLKWIITSDSSKWIKLFLFWLLCYNISLQKIAKYV